MSDNLPELTDLEKEQIEREAKEQWAAQKSPPFIAEDGRFKNGYISGATLERRRAKAEREELIKAAREVHVTLPYKLSQK